MKVRGHRKKGPSSTSGGVWIQALLPTTVWDPRLYVREKWNFYTEILYANCCTFGALVLLNAAHSKTAISIQVGK